MEELNRTNYSLENQLENMIIETKNRILKKNLKVDGKEE
jgi:hypothetical protein